MASRSPSHSPRRSITPRSASRSPLRSRSPRPVNRNPSRSQSPRSASRSPPPPQRSAKIVVEKLTKNVTEAHLREIFGVYGELREIDMPMNRQFNTNRGTAYLLYDLTTSAEQAISHMHEAQLDGTMINVSIVLPRRKFSQSPPPSRRLAAHRDRFDRRGPPPGGFRDRGPPPPMQGAGRRGGYGDYSPPSRRSPSPRRYDRDARGRDAGGYRGRSYTRSRSRSPRRSPSYGSRSRSRSLSRTPPPRRGGRGGGAAAGSRGYRRRDSPVRNRGGGGGGGGARRRSPSYSSYDSYSERSRSKSRGRR